MTAASGIMTAHIFVLHTHSVIFRVQSFLLNMEIIAHWVPKVQQDELICPCDNCNSFSTFYSTVFIGIHKGNKFVFQLIAVLELKMLHILYYLLKMGKFLSYLLSLFYGKFWTSYTIFHYETKIQIIKKEKHMFSNCLFINFIAGILLRPDM